MKNPAVSGRPEAMPALPRSIWALGMVSLLMDVSSEMIHSLLPVFLTVTLGASAATVGLIEGVGEATASFTRLFSGWLSDRLGKRKVLAVIGYGLGTLSKPLFAIAAAPAWVLGARFMDRVGKGIRGAPRDALVGDLAPPEVRGAAYGLRQSLDTIGAFAGPVIAILLMALFADDFRRVFWIALVPGVCAVVVLQFAVREPARSLDTHKARAPVRWRELHRLGGAYWSVVAVGVVLTLARFSEAFLILRAQDAGLRLALVPLVLVVMNLVYALTAYPAGKLSDRFNRMSLLGWSMVVLIGADLALAFGPGIWTVMLGVALWGLHMGMSQGLLAALVADTGPTEARGSAFGVFHMAAGVALLTGSGVAGVLWDLAGPAATFMAGAGFTLTALAGILWLRNRSAGAAAT